MPLARLGKSACPECGLFISTFTLMPQRENERGIGDRIVTIQRQIATASARDHEFTQTGLDAASDQGVLLEQGKTIEQDIGRGGCGQRIGLQQKFSQPLDVVECARRDNKPCHNLRALGRFAVRPSTFALM